MFANFEKAFFPKKESGKKIPEEVLKSLSEKLPEGYVYTSISDNAVGITPLNSPISIQGFSVQLPEGLPEQFKPSSWNELSEFIYRTQRKVKLILDEDNCIKINGNRFEVDEVIDFPFSDSKYKGADLFMVPQPFQPPFTILIKGNDVIKTLTIQRQPYPDMHKSLFKSIDNSSFELSYIVYEEEEKINFNFKTNIEKAKTIQEVIDSLNLYNSFIKGTIIINNIELPRPNEVELEDESIIETINFWEKVQVLNNLLDVEFLPEPQTEFEDVKLIEELYRSLYGKLPFKEDVNINNLTLNGYQGDTINDLINKYDLSFQFIRTSNVKLLGAEFELYSVVAFFDFIVKDVEIISDNDANLIIQPLEGKNIFQSTKHFYSLEEAKKYIEQNNISELHDAQTLHKNI
ncbi:abortive infection system toxin AbiGii family protein [Bacillus infantis]|uniref:Abortive phage resistance protein n=1 Tax=Bacillus infantis TaxID=324767 RepID=A0A5D4RLA4_9BACI|nr:abortive infection system toxin AbiGii family protein [Bacillus infantis]TYS51171.1 hypothetical protein FZD51_03790 [Bacillus infantis]